MGIGILCMSLNFSLYALALSYTTASAGGVMLNQTISYLG